MDDVSAPAAPPQQPPTAFSLWLDAFRWVAALSVLVTHTGLRMLRPLDQVQAARRTTGQYIYAFVSGFDHQAVMVFFVISGYLVGGSALAEFRRSGRVDMRAYLLRRLTRLYVVLVPALLVSMLSVVAAACLFDGLGTGVLRPDIRGSLSSAVLACNMAFLQTTLCSQYAGNTALWSLFNEFWYYVTWPAIMLFVLARGDRQGRAGLLAAALALLACLSALQITPEFLAAYMLIWIMGVLAAAAPQPLCATRTSSKLVVAVLLAIRLAIRRDFPADHPFAYAMLDFLVAGLFANLLLSLRHDTRLRQPPGGAVHARLAGFSFSLYCVHIPVLTLYGAAAMAWWGIGWDMVADNPLCWVLVLGALVASLIFAYWFSRLTEMHTDRVRHFLETQFVRKLQGSAVAGTAKDA